MASPKITCSLPSMIWRAFDDREADILFIPWVCSGLGAKTRLKIERRAFRWASWSLSENMLGTLQQSDAALFWLDWPSPASLSLHDLLPQCNSIFLLIARFNVTMRPEWLCNPIQGWTWAGTPSPCRPWKLTGHGREDNFLPNHCSQTLDWRHFTLWLPVQRPLWCCPWLLGHLPLPSRWGYVCLLHNPPRGIILHW